MTLFQEITMAVVLAVGAAVVVEYFRAKNKGDKPGADNHSSGNTPGVGKVGSKGFKFTVELDKK